MTDPDQDDEKPRKKSAGKAPSFRDKLRSDILRIGRRLIETEGLSSVQARRLAKEAGCAVGSLYNVFGDLDDFIITLNMATLHDMGLALRKAQDAHRETGLQERLMALAQAYFEFAASHPNPWRAIFEHSLPDHVSVPPEYRDDQNRLFALVEECLLTAIADPADRRNAARALFSAVHGIVSLSLDRKLGEFQQDATQRQIEFLIATAARGLARP